jgi:acetyl esterase/lipase
MHHPPFNPKLAHVLSSIPPIPDLAESHNLASQRKFFEWTAEQAFTDPEILHLERIVPGPDGNIKLSILQKRASTVTGRPGIYFLHAGGMVMGTRYTFLQTTFDWIKALDAVVISAEYRLAPEHPSPASFEDAYAGYKWTTENCKDYKIDPQKLLIAGASAGGGIAAAIALKLRDEGGATPCGQLLLYPMLDDRCTTESMRQYATEGTWTGTANKIAWDMVLPGTRGGDQVSIYQAPGRATDLSGLPPSFIEVGSAEPFRDECIEYANKLCTSGVETELHMWSGTFHSSEVFAPNVFQSQGAFMTRLNWLKALLLGENERHIIS